MSGTAISFLLDLATRMSQPQLVMKQLKRIRIRKLDASPTHGLHLELSCMLLNYAKLYLTVYIYVGTPTPTPMSNTPYTCIHQ